MWPKTFPLQCSRMALGCGQTTMIYLLLPRFKPQPLGLRKIALLSWSPPTKLLESLQNKWTSKIKTLVYKYLDRHLPEFWMTSDENLQITSSVLIPILKECVLYLPGNLTSLIAFDKTAVNWFMYLVIGDESKWRNLCLNHWDEHLGKHPRDKVGT